MNVTLSNLTESALVEILTKPKNALVKQYQSLFNIDGVELEFEEEALVAIAKKAVEHKTGARGLRSIIEEMMLDIMFEIPTNDKIEKCIISKETVEGTAEPELIINENVAALKQPTTGKVRSKRSNEDETA